MMDERQALAAFAALGQENRLRIVRALVTAGPAGLAAGTLGNEVGVAGTTMSFHLKELTHAGLVQSRREGKFVIYSVDLECLSGLIRFLMEDCCRGRPEICRPAVESLTHVCSCEPETIDD